MARRDCGSSFTYHIPKEKMVSDLDQSVRFLFKQLDEYQKDIIKLELEDYGKGQMLSIRKMLVE